MPQQNCIIINQSHACIWSGWPIQNFLGVKREIEGLTENYAISGGLEFTHAGWSRGYLVQKTLQ